VKKVNIIILGLNIIDRKILEYVCKYLSEKIFYCDCEIIESLTLEPHFYNKLREQYDSDLILNWIAQKTKTYKANVILGIGDFDAYADNLNFIFGEAYPKNHVCAVYLGRLKTSDNNLYNERIIKEVIHEIGHALGLQHCPNPECVMYFSRTINDTDHKKPMYCKKCSQILIKNNIPLKTYEPKL
jgi:archaemetzincin